MHEFEVLSPAKINLFLAVERKRPDGFHELFSLICPVNLFDRLHFSMGGEELRVLCNHPDVPENDGNLIYTAAAFFFNTLEGKGIGQKTGVTITLEKNIPVAAGLGGGSSNAASVLLALNQFFRFPFRTDTLAEIGLKIGADVPFFIYGRPAIARGVGEKLTFFNGLSPMKVLLVNPPIKVSTRSVYKNLNLRLTKCSKKFNYTLFKKQGFVLKNHLCNDLETVAESWHPEIRRTKEILKDLGAEGVLMSGSGPTVFGIFFNCLELEKAKSFFAKMKSWRVIGADLIL
jgi:4-diphosphocytidyl-2-C-methyl-D-erythritol kinase